MLPAGLPAACLYHAVLGPVLLTEQLLTAVSVSQQLLKFKDQLSAEEGSEVADALESLTASQPKKRGKCWVRALPVGLASILLQLSHPAPCCSISTQDLTRGS